MNYQSFHRVKSVELGVIGKRKIENRTFWTREIYIKTEGDGNTQITLFGEKETDLLPNT